MTHVDDALRRGLYRRSGGQCECTKRDCPAHVGRRRCTCMLYGDVWKAVKIQKKGSETLRNLLGICPSCFGHLQVRHL